MNKARGNDMKKSSSILKKTAYVILLALTCCLLLGVLVGCGDSNKLSTPIEIQMDDEYLLTWTAVKDARKYTVQIKDVSTSDTKEELARREFYSLSYLKEGDYEIKIKAVGDGKKTKDSSWSEVLAFHRDYESGCLYKLINNNSEYEIAKVGTANGVVRLDDSYRGKPITRIGNAAFKGTNKVVEIILGNKVREIGENAFYNCTKLVKINIPDSVKTIEKSAFQSCKSLTNIKIPSKVTNISAYSFAYCRALEEITIPNSVTYIDESAFQDCSALTSVVIPDSVEYIGAYAFSNDILVTDVTIGKGVVEIAKNAFFRCFELKNINFPENGKLQTIGDYVFAQCENALESVVIPEPVTTIGHQVFYDCKQLASVDLPDSLTRLGISCFHNTKLYSEQIDADSQCVYVDGWLTEITSTLKSSIRKIDSSGDIVYILSITNGEEVKEATFKESIKSGTIGIADYTFQVCPKLEEVYLPDSVKYLGEYSLYKCESLWHFVANSTSSLVSIGNYAMYNCSVLYQLKLNNCNLQTIGMRAFYGCSSLSYDRESDNTGTKGYDIVPASVKSVGSEAFYNTAMFENPNESGVVYAGNWVVDFVAGSASEIVLDENTEGIAEYCFYNAGTVRRISGVENALYIGKGAFYGCVGLASIRLNSNLEKIEPYTFFGCSSLTEVKFPYALKSIGKQAFYNCTNLQEVSLGDSEVVDIGVKAFYGCSSLRVVELGDSIEVIDDHAFYGCLSIGSMEFPDSVTKIGAHAFSQCYSIKELTFGSGITKISDYAFYSCGITNITLPENIKSVGRYAFYGCLLVESIDLGAVETIGEYAFANIKYLKGVTIPESVNEIGAYAFRGDTVLQCVMFTSNVEYVAKHVFYGCLPITIYLVTEDANSDWNLRWNSLYRPVIWGAKLDETMSYVVSVNVGEDTMLYVEALDGITGPVRSGYEFVGWATSPDATEPEYTAEELSSVPAGTKVYSLWKIPDPEEEEAGEDVLSEEN